MYVYAELNGCESHYARGKRERGARRNQVECGEQHVVDARLLAGRAAKMRGTHAGKRGNHPPWTAKTASSMGHNRGVQTPNSPYMYMTRAYD